MKKIYPLLMLLLITMAVKAQQPTPTDQPYGKVDDADVTMTSCDFEKDANAEVLIDKADLYYDGSFNVVMEHHQRIKIFNDNGKDEANFKLKFISNEHEEYITGLQGETINFINGKQEVTKLDKKQVFTQVIDKYHSEIVFTMPNVKSGSVIDVKYSWTTIEDDYIPAWYFQSDIPTRYSELTTRIPEYYYFSTQSRTLGLLAVNKHTYENGILGSGPDALSFSVNCDQRAMVNIPSLPDEPYMSSRNDNLRSIYFQLSRFTPPSGFVRNIADTWAKVGGILADNEDFGKQLRRKLTNEETIITAAKALPTDGAKINYIFNAVKTDMKWNGDDDLITIDGTSEAWDKKSGNSTEINLILYHLLKKSGINAMPMVVSTHEHGRVNLFYTFLYQFNRAVVYIPVDSTKKYILDATSKYNTCNEIPYNLLNSSGLYLDMDNKVYDMLFLQKTNPVRQSVFVNAEIKPDGKVEGTAQVSSISYDRINKVSSYKTDGEKKYTDNLRDDDNNLKISSLKLENLDVDTLPLVEDISFNLDLTGTDENYIYLNPNMFCSMRKNPFLSENRNTDIDFGCLDNINFSSTYKIPAGYKIDALPKSINMTMPDASISFRRFVAEQDGTIAVRYSISYKKWLYFKENYASFHEFIKQMYQMMNEQIVLKKS